MPIKNSVYDYETHTDKFYGIYRGVVECRFDPERLCRCKIRVWGVHDEIIDKMPKQGIPTQELPWAEACLPVGGGSVSGNGDWAVPLQGSYVWVFFENGNWMKPRYFASIPGHPIEPANPAEGFNDPMGEFPRGDWVEESDVHRLMKRDKLGETTLLEVKLPTIDLGVDIAFGGTWDEYPPMYQAEYPFNNVVYHHSGIYTEIDNTEGNRRYHIYHPSNSYLEIGEIGQMTIRNAEKRWDICDDMKMEHVMNDYHRKIDTNRTSLVLLDQWDEIYLNRYSRIHINDRKDVYVDQIYHIFNDKITQIDNNRHQHILANDTLIIDADRQLHILANDTTIIDADKQLHVLANDTTIIDADKQLHVLATNTEIIDDIETSLVKSDRVYITKADNTDYSDGEKNIQSMDVIHIQSATEIVLEAPTVRIKAEEFLDHAAYTEIADLLTWNGVALGKSTSAVASDTALIAKTLGSASAGAVFGVGSEAPAPPEPPEDPSEPPEPPNPPVPEIPDIPAPPIPPVPPVLDYSDIPPEPDPCPPSPCEAVASVIV